MSLLSHRKEYESTTLEMVIKLMQSENFWREMVDLIGNFKQRQLYLPKMRDVSKKVSQTLFRGRRVFLSHMKMIRKEIVLNDFIKFVVKYKPFYYLCAENESERKQNFGFQIYHDNLFLWAFCWGPGSCGMNMCDFGLGKLLGIDKRGCQIGMNGWWEFRLLEPLH